MSFFHERQVRTFVDATLGAGGHSLALVQEHPEIEKLIAIDQDPTALDIAKKRLEDFSSKVVYALDNFSSIHRILQQLYIESVDGIFLDLGVSSMQFDTQERGFSFMKDAPLDMRMSPQGDISASDIVNSWREEDIAQILYEFGEEGRSRRIAKAIVTRRKQKRIETTCELAELVAAICPKQGRIHPATKTFQALRIAVNDELDVLHRVIPQAIDSLSPGGRLGIISFHSLEDRIVKNAFRAYHASGKIMLLTKKPLVPSREEMAYNRRARSAKMRFIERI